MTLLLEAGTGYMDSETSAAFAKVLEYIVNSLGKAVENNGAQTLEYLKGLGDKIVAYKAGIAWLWMGLAILLLVISIITFIVARVTDSGEWLFVTACTFVMAVIVAMVNAYDLIECYTFPEKTIIDYISTEYNNMSTGVR